MIDTRTALYRHWNAADDLLYVGISMNVARRTCAHSERSHWYDDIARISVEWFDGRREALEAEAHAIRSERPLWNRRRPKSTERIVYFIEEVDTGLRDGYYTGQEYYSGCDGLVGLLAFWAESRPEHRHKVRAIRSSEARYIGDHSRLWLDAWGPLVMSPRP